MISVQTQQVLVPKQVYIGDSAELRCVFNFDSPELQALVSNGQAQLSLQNFTQPLDSRQYEIKKVTLSQTGVNFYQLTITFVPWQTGELVFSPYQLEGLTFEFEPVNIVSITQQNSITAIQDSTAPLLLPGTTYKLYSSIAVGLLLLIFAIRCIVHHKQVAFFIKNLGIKIKNKKNAKKTKKELQHLAGKDISEKELASQIQRIMRNYLEVRFAYPFTRTVTTDLMKGFYEATCGLLSDRKEESFETFVAAFIRTDYIRFSGQVHFEQGEVDSLVKDLIEKITIIETPDPVEKEEKKAQKNEGGTNV